MFLYYIPAALFQPIYLTIIFVLTVLAFRDVKRPPHVKEQSTTSFLICLFFIWFIGNRPVSDVFFDMMGYAIAYVFELRWEGFQTDINNVLFVNLSKYMADGMHAHYTTYFQVLAILFFLPAYFACRKFFPNHTLLSFLVFLGAFSTFGGAVNGLKNGIATSFFALALAYRYHDMKLMVLFICCSIGFHHSMQLMIGALAITFVLRDTKYYFTVWLVCLVLCALHVTYFQEMFLGFTDDQAAKYLDTSKTDTAGGFRPDFILYSAVPIAMGYYMKFRCKWEDKMYDLLLNVYLAANSLWLLCMYANFTNRIAALSWSIYPWVLLYPCFRVNDQNHFVVKNRNIIIMMHLSFTMFMHFVLGR